MYEGQSSSEWHYKCKVTKLEFRLLRLISPSFECLEFPCRQKHETISSLDHKQFPECRIYIQARSASRETLLPSTWAPVSLEDGKWCHSNHLNISREKTKMSGHTVSVYSVSWEQNTDEWNVTRGDWVSHFSFGFSHGFIFSSSLFTSGHLPVDFSQWIVLRPFTRVHKLQLNDAFLKMYLKNSIC